MGLDMYLYKSTRPRFEIRKKYDEAMDEYWLKWGPVFKCFPRKETGFEIDEAKLTEEDRMKLDQAHREEDEIKVSLNYTDNTPPDQEIHYWRKFNALHGFIVREFADGVDECQPIMIGGKDGIKKILDALRATKSKLDRGCKNHKVLAMPPTPGFFFGSVDIDDWFTNDVKEALDFFEELYNKIGNEEIVYYRASW